MLSTLGLFTLLMCQSQKASEVTNTTNIPIKSTPVKNSDNNGTPEMSVGLPPDKEAEKIAAQEQSNSTNMASNINLKEGQALYFKDNKTNITFKSIISDSRCPEDVNCIWAGVATAEIELLGPSKRPLTILLSTMDDTNKGFQKSVNFDGYNYSLTNVSPELTSEKGFKALKGQYKIDLKIEKGTSESTILQRN